ncbi:MAG: hypothetical protein ACTJLM_04975 [Ehrlichia sp.]
MSVDIIHLMIYNRSIRISKMSSIKKELYEEDGTKYISTVFNKLRYTQNVEPKECLIFIPLVLEEINSLTISSIELKHDSDVGGYCIYVKENRGLLPSKTKEFKLNTDCQCKIVNKVEFSKIDKPGLCVLIRDGLDLIKIKEECLGFNIKSLKIETGSVLLTYDGRKPIKDAESLKSFLLGLMPGCDNVSRGEALIRTLFKSCPDNEELMYPKSKYGFENAGKEFWIDTPHGQMAMHVLSMLSPVELLNGKRFRETRGSAFEKQFKYLVDYVKRERITVSECDVTNIFRFMKCHNLLGKIVIPNCYGDPNDAFSADVRLRLSNMMRKSLKENRLYLYIFAIASCQHDGDYVQVNDYIKELLELAGVKEDVDKLQDVLIANGDKPIRCDSYQYKDLNINELLREACKQGLMEEKVKVTGEQLVKMARSVICKRYGKLKDLESITYSDLKSITCEDLQCNMYLSIFFIATYELGSDDIYPLRENIRRLLREETYIAFDCANTRYSDMIDYYFSRHITPDTSAYNIVKIPEFLRIMSEEGIPGEVEEEYTGKQLTEFARSLINKMYYDQIITHCETVNTYVEQIKSSTDIVLMDEGIREATCGIQVNVVSDHAVGIQ